MAQARFETQREYLSALMEIGMIAQREASLVQEGQQIPDHPSELIAAVERLKERRFRYILTHNQATKKEP